VALWPPPNTLGIAVSWRSELLGFKRKRITKNVLPAQHITRANYLVTSHLRQNVRRRFSFQFSKTRSQGLYPFRPQMKTRQPVFPAADDRSYHGSGVYSHGCHAGSMRHRLSGLVAAAIRVVTLVSPPSYWARSKNKKHTQRRDELRGQYA